MPFQIKLPGIPGRVDHRLHAVPRLQVVQQDTQLLPGGLRVRRIGFFVPVKLKVHGGRQHLPVRGNRPDEVFELPLGRTVKAEKMVGPGLDPRLPGLVPVLPKPVVHHAAALCGLDVGELDALALKSAPVDIPLVMGHVHPAHRVAQAGGVV